MRKAAMILSVVALVATILPSCMYFLGQIDPDNVKIVALIGTIVWFAATPLWMGRELRVDAKEVEI